MKGGGAIDLARCGLSLIWAVLGYAKCADQPSGDGYTILRLERGLLFAVADGSGSGAAAAHAAELCLATLARSEGQMDQDFSACHDRLKGGRGAALALLALNAATGEITWASVGDVEGVVLRKTDGGQMVYAALTQIGGTLGSIFNGIAPQTCLLAPGDLIVLTTDGVLRDCARKIATPASAEAAAEEILRRFRRPNDDSLALVIEVRARQ